MPLCPNQAFGYAIGFRRVRPSSALANGKGGRALRSMQGKQTTLPPAMMHWLGRNARANNTGRCLEGRWLNSESASQRSLPLRRRSPGFARVRLPTFTAYCHGK